MTQKTVKPSRAPSQSEIQNPLEPQPGYSRFATRLFAVFLFISGACALIYQLAWLKQFRLVFGGATPATAAVLAIFMGGLGVGSAILGRRVETARNPFRWYALIEIGIGVSAMLTPVVHHGIRWLYLQTGGIASLGLPLATLLQLVLATLLLAVPCLLIGGSLPVALTCVETDRDTQRGDVGMLYGINTLGALAGVLAATFWLLESFGTRNTIWIGGSLNVLIGALAWLFLARGRGEQLPAAKQVPVDPVAAALPDTRPGFIYLAAGITGFTFFLAELVWMRMLAPLVGSSVYGFGLILAMALAGIGLGGLLYRLLWQHRRATLMTFATVAALQAILLAVPWALGDRIAVLAIDLSQLRAYGLSGQLVGWSLVTSLLVFGPALIAGLQFPILVSLLGQGSKDVGVHIGYSYAANTLGAILGSLTTGFLLLPWLTAPGCWRLAVVLNLGLSLAAVILSRRTGARPAWVAVPLWIAAGLLIALPLGPTGAWRHQPIGYGRVEALPVSINDMKNWLNNQRFNVVHEFEGRESSVATVNSDEGYAFFVNGKSDGSAFGDAPTQVMLGLVTAMLHPAPQNAFVIGLGTGSSAGWLAEVPGMQRVEVAEVEPGMLRLAHDYFAPVNRNVLDKPNVQVRVGDAREALLTAGPAYDLIISEPSNPYRAGVASLFTREFYESARQRLAPGGLFGQWVQGYEIDAQTIRLICATMTSVFPYVEAWVSQPGDLLFVGHLSPPAYSYEHLQARVAQAPFAEAMRRVWFDTSVEGLLAHYLAAPEVVKKIATTAATLATDDRNNLEYGFTRALSRDGAFDSAQILARAREMHMETPPHLGQQGNPVTIQLHRLLMLAAEGMGFTIDEQMPEADRRRAASIRAYLGQDYAGVLANLSPEAQTPLEQLIHLEAASAIGPPEQVRQMLPPIAGEWPANARFGAARSAARHGDFEPAIEHLKAGFSALRTQVWSRSEEVQKALSLTAEIVTRKPEFAAAMLESLRQPFPAGIGEDRRITALMAIAHQMPLARQYEVVEMLEPHPPWIKSFLEFRLMAYRHVGDPRAQGAERDLREFLREADAPL